jgi:sigma-B regulation protein RsbU (phosphoserine phosphatase)
VLQRNEQYIGLDAFVDLLALAKREQGVDHILDTIIQLQAGETPSDDMSLMMVSLD